MTMITPNGTCFDVRYNNSVVSFYDEKLKEIGNVSLTVQCHRNDISSVSDGKNKITMLNGMCLCYDATNIRSHDVGSSYPWYVMSSALIKAGMNMNTVWNPAYAYIEKGIPLVRNFSEKSNIIIVPDIQTSLTLKSLSDTQLSELKLPAFKQYLVMPLRETITHLFPIYTGMTLMRMAIYFKKAYIEEWMEDVVVVMSSLFEQFVDEFNKLSKKEACSLTDLHICFFQNTFKVSMSIKPVSNITPNVSFYSTKPDERVTMVTKSSLFSVDEYGDTAWFLASDKEREAVSGLDKVKHWNGVFVILPEEPRLLIRGERITYVRLVIFPQLRIEGYIHEYGSMIGLLPSGHLDYRGTLFEEMTPREEMIVQSLFGHFINRTLQPDFNPIEIYKATRCPGRCRTEFVEEIKRVFLTHNAGKQR